MTHTVALKQKILQPSCIILTTAHLDYIGCRFIHVGIKMVAVATTLRSRSQKHDLRFIRLFPLPPWHYEMTGGVCTSIACSQLTRERKGLGSTKLEAHHTDKPWTYSEVKRSKIKVTGSINAVTDNAPFAHRWEFVWRKKGESESIFH